MFNGQEFMTDALPVGARVLLTRGDGFQSHIPDLAKLHSAFRTKQDCPYAPADYVVAVGTLQCGWHHVMYAPWTLHFLQHSFEENM